MKKALMQRIPRECWLCGRNGNGEPLELHHCFGGANRRKSEQYGACVYLCANRCHRNGPEAVHRNAETNRRLHEWAQKKLMEENGWTVDDFRLEFGRNYMNSEEIPSEPSEADREGRGGAAKRTRPAAGGGASDTELATAI